MDLIAGIDSDQYFASKANYLKVLEVSSYEELKSLIDEARQKPYQNSMYETANFYKHSKQRQRVKYAQILKNQSLYFCI